MRRFSSDYTVRIAVVALAVGGLVISAAGCSAEGGPAEAATMSGNGEPQDSDEGLPVVTVVTPRRTLLERTTTQPATVHANFQAEIYAKVSGYLAELRADIGQQVEQGEVLAVIAVPEMQKRLEHQQMTIERLQAEEQRAQAGVELAEANLQSARARVEQARADIAGTEAEVAAQQAEHERVKDLVERNSVESRLLDEARKKFDAAKANKLAAEAALDSATAEVKVSEAKRNTARADLRIAEAETQAARKKLEEIEALTGYATLKAPFSGVITERHVDPGDLVRNIETASDPSRDPLFTIAQVETIRVRTTVPERDAPWVDVGDAATVHLQALRRRSPKAEVTRTSHSLDTSSQTMLVEIEVDNPDGTILPGMYGEATVVMESKVDALVLPAHVVRHDEEGRSYVFVINGGNTLRKTEVRAGVDTGTQIEIVSGLDGSERVVDASVENFEDGQKVRVQRGG